MSKSGPTWDARAPWLGGSPLMVFTHRPPQKSANSGVSSRREGWIPLECRDQRAVHLLVAFSPSCFITSFCLTCQGMQLHQGPTFPKSLGFPPASHCKKQSRWAFPARAVLRKLETRACACCKKRTMKVVYPHSTSTQPGVCMPWMLQPPAPTFSCL